MFVQKFAQTDTKGNINVPHHWSFVRGIHRWFPSQRASSMMSSSNGNIFRVLLAICAGNSPVPHEFPAQRPVTQSFCAFFDLRLNKRLSKQAWGWWFETLSHPLWRHLNDAWDYYTIVVPGNAESISLLWRHNANDTLPLECTNRQYTPLYSPSRGLVQFQWQYIDVGVNVPMERQAEFNGYIWFEIWILIK